MSLHKTPTEALSCLQSGHRVFIHGGAATPFKLLEGLIGNAKRIRGVELIHIHTEGKADYANEEYKDSFRITNLFVGANMRKKLDYDRVDYLPCFLSEIPMLFRSGKRPIDIALIHVSAPDEHGFCSLGTSVDVARTAVEVAQIVVAQVNKQMPRVHGDGFIHISEIDHYIEVDEILPEHRPAPLREDEKAIGRFCAELVEDGATLQTGIGNIPDAVLASLTGHRNLGIHTELFSDGLLKLLKCGAVNNSKKKVHPGKTVSGFMMGTQELYKYVHNNPSVVQLDITYVNDPAVIRRNPKVTAINSAVEVDLTGQVCADSIGH
ncbi:MAG: 4-hydroxybutyrate CoA-transferase, partial [Bdellovibrionales bacterium GWC1_52_8]